MTDNTPEYETADAVDEASEYIESALATACLFIVGAIAGIPGAIFVGGYVLGDVLASGGGGNQAGALAAASAAGFGVVVASSLALRAVIGAFAGVGR